MLPTRPACEQDREFLRKLHHAVYHDLVVRQFGAWDEADQDSLFSQSLEDADFEVIEENGIAVGVVGTKEYADHLFLAEIQILPDYQRRGIGTAMLDVQIRRAERIGKPLRLQVLRANRARAWYERHGFAAICETDSHYIMQRP